MIRPILILAISLISLSLFAQKQPKQKGDPNNKDKVVLHQQKVETPEADSVYQWRIRQEKLNGTYIPKDLNDCFAQLDVLMDADVKTKFLSFPDSTVDKYTHNTIGKWIAFKWELLEGSRISAYFNQMQVPHPDYMVSLILISYHRHLNKVDLGLKEQIKFYREHWKKRQAEKAKKALKEAKEKEKGK